MRALFIALGTAWVAVSAASGSKTEGAYPFAGIPPELEVICEGARYGMTLSDGGSYEFVALPGGRWGRCVSPDAGNR